MIVRYEIKYWDELDHDTKIEKGITARGNTIGEIVENLYEYFGTNNIMTLKIYECEDIMCDEELEEIFKEDT